MNIQWWQLISGTKTKTFAVLWRNCEIKNDDQNDVDGDTLHLDPSDGRILCTIVLQSTKSKTNQTKIKLISIDNTEMITETKHQ